MAIILHIRDEHLPQQFSHFKKYHNLVAYAVHACSQRASSWRTKSQQIVSQLVRDTGVWLGVHEFESFIAKKKKKAPNKSYDEISVKNITPSLPTTSNNCVLSQVLTASVDKYHAMIRSSQTIHIISGLRKQDKVNTCMTREPEKWGQHKGIDFQPLCHVHVYGLEAALL